MGRMGGWPAGACRTTQAAVSLLRLLCCGTGRAGLVSCNLREEHLLCGPAGACHMTQEALNMQALQHSYSGQQVLLQSSCRCSLSVAVYCRAGGRALHKGKLKACTV